MDSKECPADVEDLAEAYVMGKLTAGEAATFEDHYVGCNNCAMVLQQAAEYVEAMREAARKSHNGLGAAGS